MMINKEFLFNMGFRTKEELFKLTTEYLVTNNYVYPEFEVALNIREKEFPTGLPIVPSVAIPHTDGTFVKNNALVCIVNQYEIVFNEMGGDEEDVVLPKVFFMLVLKEGGTHLDQLQNLIEKIQGSELVRKSLESKSLEEFKNIVNMYL